MVVLGVCALPTFPKRSSSYKINTRYVKTQTRGVDHGGWGIQTPRKFVGGVRVCFDPPKMSHSFIQNCCWITASFTS